MNKIDFLFADSLIYNAIYLAMAEKNDLLPNKISHEPPTDMQYNQRRYTQFLINMYLLL